MELSNQDNQKPNKTKQIILILLIISVIAVVITVVLMMYLSSIPEEPVIKKDKIFVDDQEKATQVNQVLLTTAEGEKYFLIKELASLVGYDYFNGEYLKFTEDTSKCYVENIVKVPVPENEQQDKVEEKYISNIVGLEADSNMIYKTNSTSNLDFEIIPIKNKILEKENGLYISIEDIGIVFGIVADYSEENGLVIYTSNYLNNYYNNKAVENGYASINTEQENSRTLAYNLLLVNKNNRYGITDLNFVEKVGIKYDTIEFNEQANEFIVSSGNKYGIIDENGNIKINLLYDEIDIINYSPLLYKVKSDNKYGIINETGKLISNIIYEQIGYEPDATSTTEYGAVVIPQLNDEINQSIVVKDTNGYGLIDAKTGEPIIDNSLEKIYSVLEDGETVYEAIFKGQKVDLIQYIKAVNTIVVTM